MGKSLAGSERMYAPIQVRSDGNGLHIQAPGSGGNRPRYMSADVDAAPEALRVWLDGLATRLSLAGTGGAYTLGQAAPNDDGSIHVQVSGINSVLNREYGASFDLSGDNLEELAEFLAANMPDDESDECLDYDVEEEDIEPQSQAVLS